MQGIWQKKVQFLPRKSGNPDHDTRFQNFRTRFWPFHALICSFPANFKNVDFCEMVITLKSSTKWTIFGDFFHSHDQKSDFVHFHINHPLSEHFFLGFTRVFLRIMHIYWKYFVTAISARFFIAAFIGQKTLCCTNHCVISRLELLKCH